MKLRDGQRTVCAEGCDRAFDAVAAAIPRLALRVARADEERELVFGRAGRDDGDGFGFGEAGQVVEIRILAVAIFRVVRACAFGCAGDDGDRVRLHAAYELFELGSAHACLLRAVNDY